MRQTAASPPARAREILATIDGYLAQAAPGYKVEIMTVAAR